MSGHTPGPWLPSGWEFTDGNRSKFRFVIQFERPVSGQIEAQNNANLIAAAPDLLEALEAFERIKDIWLPVEAEEQHTEEMYTLHMARNNMLAAIARAKGKA